MHPSFKEGFEKQAGLGGLLLKGVKSVGKKLTGNMTSVGKAGQKLKKPRWEFSKGKAGLAAMGGAFGASEVADVIGKTKNSSNAMRTVSHRGMHGKSINNLPRHTNINSGMGQTSIR